MCDPKIIFGDEPTGALDSSSAGDGLAAREERLASWLTSMEF